MLKIYDTEQRLLQLAGSTNYSIDDTARWLKLNFRIDPIYANDSVTTVCCLLNAASLSNLFNRSLCL